ADEILARNKERVAADFPGVGESVFDVDLDEVARQARDLVAREDLDIAVGFGKRAVRAKLQRIEEARIQERIARLELKRIRLKAHLGFDTLRAHPADVLEEAESRQPRNWGREDVVVVGGAVGADLPAERADVQFLGAAEARFHGLGYDLLQ